ncbi:hypothetical protein HELRODRAFT_175961 [Helobdella robusta]|uniref:Uncharacterized protein n=1 Tax=Helobdella robusta TaxID=6412 RepID=T1F9Z1_HELRO|nr:hypothetical protein HELRODRAFT_175961 [Helobdella robusta]ESO00518.1 hypothetical protein HELRODRAFT_175961 [Helobdella robusta]
MSEFFKGNNTLDIRQYATAEISSISNDLRYDLLKNPWKPDENYKFSFVLEGFFTQKHNDKALAAKIIPSFMLRELNPLFTNQLQMLAEAFPDLPSARSLQSEYER